MTSAPEQVYHQVRFTYDRRRVAPWRAIASYLKPWIDANSNLLELGAGYGEFLKSVDAAHKWAVDQNLALVDYWGPGITPLIQDALEPLPLASHMMGTVFASNFFEHLTLDEARLVLSEAARVLLPGGHLIVVQPNFRLQPRRYFDDYTHRTIYTDCGFQDFLSSEGWRIKHSEPRFMPFSMKSRLPTAEWLVRMYLALPFRPMAGQFLVIADKPDRRPGVPHKRSDREAQQ